MFCWDFSLQACCPQVFPSFSIRNISSFLHCPLHCISCTSRYLSFHLKSLLNFSHRACSVSFLILVVLLVLQDPVGNEKPKLQIVFKVLFYFSLSSLFDCGVGGFIDVLLLVGFGEFLTLSWYLCIITVFYFIIL